MSRIVLGVAGGIAAYKACSLLRRFTEGGHEVEVVPTLHALQFVGAATWAALSGRSVSTDVFSHTEQVNHVRIGREADLVVIAPATADLIARAAAGRADDLLTNVLLTASCPVVLAPAMHTEMWQHPATQANVATLRSRGVVVLEPADGRLTGSDTGPGRLPEPADIQATALALLADPDRSGQLSTQDLAGEQIVISAGGTREALDPVRYLGNTSSGLMGIALARAAATRGAVVTLVAANLSVEPPAGVSIVPVVSTADLDAELKRLAPTADLVVMAAAAADFTPRQPSRTKLKKSGQAGISVDFQQTPDVLADVASARRPGQVVVGFAAETANGEAELLRLGTAKLQRKGCQLLVLNNVADGAIFGSDDNDVIILSGSGEVARAAGSKTSVAHVILDAATSQRERKLS
jgi:phosphopantothenoylcysteine decarboxylase / phosphopantothenate---cysteine ligase